jgi:predicted RNA binding protein YcfA (HicA-like mRNA interferase family)
MSREMDKVRRDLLKNGFSARRTKKGHWVYSHPNMSGTVTASGSPSDHRGIQNLKAMLRRKLNENQFTDFDYRTKI